MTSCLSITAKRMAQRNVLVKRTNIIESLGSATVIASDKTGTLTQNRMTVENLWYNRSVYNAYAGGRPDVLEQMAKSNYRRATASASMNKRVVVETLDEDSEVTLDANGASVLRLAAKTALSRRGSLDNEMTMGGNAFTVTGFNSNTLMSASALPGAKLAWEKFSGHARLMTIAGVCNRARYEDSEAGAMGSVDRKILGDASDAGLLRYADKLYPVAIARRMFPKVFEIPFNSVNKWSLAVVPDPAGPQRSHIVFLKGAPEIVMSRCSDFMYHGGTRPIDDDWREEYTAAYERFGSCGERVLGFAYKVIPACKPEAYSTEAGAPPSTGLTFCGLISLVDPPRPGVAEAIATCRNAGIKVTMVTGGECLFCFGRVPPSDATPRRSSAHRGGDRPQGEHHHAPDAP